MSHHRITQDWKVEISCNQHELGGSFSVFIFLGDVPADPQKWLFDNAFVGSFDIYTYTDSVPSESLLYNEDADAIVNGSVLLSRAILRFSGQQSLQEDAVLPFLRRRLNWGVQKVRNGSSILVVNY